MVLACLFSQGLHLALVSLVWLPLLSSRWLLAGTLTLLLTDWPSRLSFEILGCLCGPASLVLCKPAKSTPCRDIKVCHQEEQNLGPSSDRGYSDLGMYEGSGGDSCEAAEVMSC